MRDSLGRNRKIHSSALAKVNYPADNPINLESWIEIYERNCAPRFALENESWGDNWVNADIEQASTAPFGPMPDIVWVVEIEREEGLDGMDPSQTSLANQSSYFVPLGDGGEP
jgi:hypothetical protein